MRNSVPFIGEGQISRVDSDESAQKRQSGQLIDDAIPDASAESSWDDVVPDTWGGNRSKALRPSPGVRKPLLPQQTLGKHLVQGTKTASKIPIYSPGDYLASGKGLDAYIDWVPINSGHGLRINVTGCIDHNLRSEWKRLLDETAATSASEFEFNLTATPVLTMTGLGMLLLFKERKAATNKGAIKLCNCNKDVWQLLNWTGMEKFFVIKKGSDF